MISTESGGDFEAKSQWNAGFSDSDRKLGSALEMS